MVDRRVRNLIHSDLTTRAKLRWVSLGGGLSCVEVVVGEVRVLVLIGARLL
jgi:hypothetical protein